MFNLQRLRDVVQIGFINGWIHPPKQTNTAELLKEKRRAQNRRAMQRCRAKRGY